MIFKSRISLLPLIWLPAGLFWFVSEFSDFRRYQHQFPAANVHFWNEPWVSGLLAGVLGVLAFLIPTIAALGTRIELGEESIWVHCFWHHREIPYDSLRTIKLPHPALKKQGMLRISYLDKNRANQIRPLDVNPVDRQAFLSALETRTRFFPIGEQLPLADLK